MRQARRPDHHRRRRGGRRGHRLLAGDHATSTRPCSGLATPSATRYQLYQHNAPDTGATGLAVLSRFPVIDRGHHPGPHGWHPGLARRGRDAERPDPDPARSPARQAERAQQRSGRAPDRAARTTSKRSISSCAGRRPTSRRWWSATSTRKRTAQPSVGSKRAATGTRCRCSGRSEHTWRHPFLAWELRQTLDHILFDRAFVPLDARVIARRPLRSPAGRRALGSGAGSELAASGTPRGTRHAAARA